MYKTFLFSVAIVFCVDVYVISAEEVSANDVAVAQPQISDFISVDTAEVKQLLVNGSELEVARINECKCENGKCMRKCDIEKTVPCVDETKVCVCDPEFAETKPGVCKYCDCGPGSNCTFRMEYYPFEKNCICTKGYYKSRFNNTCVVECSDEQPCKNGGKCSYGKCSCPSGTYGTLCEELLCSACVNRLEVDCLYDQQERTSYCSCKNPSLYYDYGRDICIPCPCGRGRCYYEITYYSRKLKCDCDPGYEEYNGYCRECNCGSDAYCDFDYNGKKTCDCPTGFFEREGHCVDCDCMVGHNIKCEVTGNEKRCFCEEGQKDVLGHCEYDKECEKNNTCHPSTTCFNTYSDFKCLCPEGYRGYLGDAVKAGEVCEDINECKEMLYPCSYSQFTKCVNVPGSYKCECRPGYEPYRYGVPPYDTKCIATKKSWGPALIVIFTSCALIGVSCSMHAYVKKRAARLN